MTDLSSFPSSGKKHSSLWEKKRPFSSLFSSSLTHSPPFLLPAFPTEGFAPPFFWSHSALLFPLPFQHGGAVAVFLAGVFCSAQPSLL